MATATALPQERVLFASGEQRLVLHGIDWAMYRKLSDALTGTRVRFTYDRGAVELMTRSQLHEKLSRLAGRMIVVLTEEFGLPLSSVGEMTCDREDLDRGLEPDECFYITHEEQMRGKREVGLESDPPPDLAVEVEVSRGVRSRLPIYAALGIPEVWRCDEGSVAFLRLNPAGAYEPAAASRYFPGISAADVAAFLSRHDQTEENQLMREFRAFLRERTAGQ